MPATLSARGQRMLADLPPYYQEDPFVWAVVDTAARELQRIEDALNTIRAGFFPQTADDSMRLLSLWEATLGLPVAPSGITLDDRRAKVLAVLRSRGSGSGADWVAAIQAAVGSSNWTHQENYPGDYQLLITVPFPSNSYNAGVVAALARDITPAHIEVTVAADGGFIVDTSLVDSDVI